MNNRLKTCFLSLLMFIAITPSMHAAKAMHADKTSTFKGTAKIVGGLALMTALGFATFKFATALIENRAIASGKYQRLGYSDTDKCPHWAYAFAPLAIIPGFIIGGSLIKQGWSEIPKYPFFSLKKQELTDQLKADIYRVFTQEMWIVSKDFNAMAQGNAELEKDLKNLYASFVSKEDAQQKLDAFCKKWDLEKIDIA